MKRYFLSNNHPKLGGAGSSWLVCAVPWSVIGHEGRFATVDPSTRPVLSVSTQKGAQGKTVSCNGLGGLGCRQVVAPGSCILKFQPNR